MKLNFDPQFDLESFKAFVSSFGFNPAHNDPTHSGLRFISGVIEETKTGCSENYIAKKYNSTPETIQFIHRILINSGVSLEEEVEDCKFLEDVLYDEDYFDNQFYDEGYH